MCICRINNFIEFHWTLENSVFHYNPQWKYYDEDVVNIGLMSDIICKYCHSMKFIGKYFYVLYVCIFLYLYIFILCAQERVKACVVLMEK